MTTLLTDFVGQMIPGTPGPSPELFDEAWAALRGILRAEMRRRSVWTGPPRFLGVVGYGSWTLPGRETDALDELTAQCFEWVFVNRLTSLRAQAERKPSVDGLITLAVRHFLLETQRQNDPLGFRIFEVARRVAQKAVDEEGLVLVGGDARIRNDTLLALEPGADTKRLQAVDPSPLAERWASDHLEGLVTASHRRLSDLMASLTRELVGWLGPEKPGFRFGDLAAPLKQTCRAAWGQRFLGLSFVVDPQTGEPTDPNTGTSEPRLTKPGAFRRFAHLARCVQRSLHELGGRAKTQAYLERLWRFLESFAVHEEVAGLRAKADDELPSHRQLGKLLDIPRERIPGLLDALGGRLRECRERIESLPEEIIVSPPSGPDTPSERARASLRAALDRMAAGKAAPASESPASPEFGPGWIVNLPGADVPGVSWLLLAAEPGGERFRAAPVDTFPLLGPRDLPLGEAAHEHESDGAPWNLRRELETSLTVDQLTHATRSEHLDGEALAALLDDPDVEGLQRVEAGQPDYREWIEEGPARAHALATARLLPFARPEGAEAPTLGRPWAGWKWLAAVLALAATSLALQTVRLSERVDQLSAPILDLPYVELKLDATFRGSKRLEVAQSATHVQVGLVLRGLPDHPVYRIDLVDAEGRVLYRSPELDAAPDYTLTFRRDQLEPPPVSFRLYGVTDGEATLLDEHELKLAAEESR